jgi:hypothetical protein
MALLDKARTTGLEIHIEAALLGLVDLGATVGAALHSRALLAATPLEIHGRGVAGEIVQKGLRNFEERHLYFILKDVLVTCASSASWTSEACCGSFSCKPCWSPK